MKRIILLTLITSTFIAQDLSFAQDAKNRGLEVITKRAVQGQLEFLASDWTEAS